MTVSPTARLFPTRCVDAKLVDFSGVDGGFLLWPRPQLVEVSERAAPLCLAGLEDFEFVNNATAADGLLSRAIRRCEFGRKLRLLPCSVNAANQPVLFCTLRADGLLIFPNTTTRGGGGACLSSLALSCTGTSPSE